MLPLAPGCGHCRPACRSLSATSPPENAYSPSGVGTSSRKPCWIPQAIRTPSSGPSLVLACPSESVPPVRANGSDAELVCSQAHTEHLPRSGHSSRCGVRPWMGKDHSRVRKGLPQRAGLRQTGLPCPHTSRRHSRQRWVAEAQPLGQGRPSILASPSCSPGGCHSPRRCICRVTLRREQRAGDGAIHVGFGFFLKKGRNSQQTPLIGQSCHVAFAT